MGTLIAFVITTVGTAAAKEVSIKGHRPSQVKAACKGVFAPPSAANGSYGCLNKNGMTFRYELKGRPTWM
jgi:hypothetical protein